MSTILNDNAREALAAGNLAHLVTLNPDGSPQVSIVWVGLDGDEIICAHLAEHLKIKNIRNDPRVALSIETGGENEFGLDNYLVVTGRAYIVEGGAPEVLNRLAQVYIGAGVDFPPGPLPPPGYVTHIVPERVYGTGPWKTDIGQAE